MISFIFNYYTNIMPFNANYSYSDYLKSATTYPIAENLISSANIYSDNI
jgi:hypothetical protein